jgi:pyrroloquinoline-quinone synthase
MQGRLDTVRDSFIRDVKAHPFLNRCRHGQVPLDELTVFLTQQELYSRHFTRFLCALMSNLESNAHVYALAANLFEELGLDGKDATPHSVLFCRMLGAFGIDHRNQLQPLAGTEELVTVMYAQCRDVDYAKGLGALCLGAEALVPELYRDIVAGFEALGPQGDKIDFFRIHIECDDGHSQIMQKILEDLIDSDSRKFNVVECAARRVVEARLRFFDSIEETARKMFAGAVLKVQDTRHMQDVR